MGALVQDRSVRDFVAAHEVAQPGNTFLINPETGLEVTWGALQCALDRCSPALGALGIRHQQVVSVMMQNSWGSVQAIMVRDQGRVLEGGSDRRRPGGAAIGR